MNQFFLFCSFEGKLTPCSDDEDKQSTEKIQQILIPLMTWIAATERWPTLRRLLMQKYIEFWQQIQTNVTEQRAIEDPEAKQLLANKGFKEFFQQTVAYDMNKIMAQFRAAEIMLRSHGL
jgi:hypothetical protein